MTAASFWSLLAPAIEMAEESGNYGMNGEFAFVPVAIGFALGALFVFAADVLMPFMVRKQVVYSHVTVFIFVLETYIFRACTTLQWR